MALKVSAMEPRIKPETNIRNSSPSGMSLPCRVGADCVWVLERADKMVSGVISTFDRMFARGLWDVVVAGAGVFRLLERLPGLVGVPGEGLDAGLTPGGRKMNSWKCISKWPLNPWYFPLKMSLVCLTGILLWPIHKGLYHGLYKDRNLKID